MTTNKADSLDELRQYANRIRDAYTLTEAEDLLGQFITKATTRADAKLAFATGWIARVCADYDLEFPEQLSLPVEEKV